MTRNDFNVLAIYAFRYALGRTTYTTSEMCELLVRRMDELSPSTQQLMIKEINRAFIQNKSGMCCDVDEWKTLLDALNGIEYGD